MDERVEELKADAEVKKAAMDNLVESKYRDMREKYGIPTLFARLVDVTAIVAGVWFILEMSLPLQLAGAFLILGGLFGFVNNLGGDE